MASFPSPEQSFERKQTAQVVSALLSELPDRYRMVMEERFGFFGEPRTYRSIGEDLGCGVERVRRIEAKALRYLRSPSKAKRLRDVSSLVPGRVWVAPQRYPRPEAEQKASATTHILFKLKRQESVWAASPAFAAWLDQLILVPAIKDIKPWMPWDFHWPYRIGMTPEQAVEFAIKIDAASDDEARNRLFKIAQKEFGR